MGRVLMIQNRRNAYWIDNRASILPLSCSSSDIITTTTRPKHDTVIQHLLLRSLRLLRLSLGPLLPHTHQPRLAPRLPQLAIRILRPFRHLTPLHLPNGLLTTAIPNRQRQPRLPDNLAFILHVLRNLLL